MLQACAPTYIVRGHVKDDDALGEIRPGIHDETSVQSLLGSPTTRNSFGDPVWYYVSRRSERSAFFEDDLLEHQVVAIHFDDVGIVRAVKVYDNDDIREVAFADRETPTRGRELTLMEQLFGNLGRFNQQ